MIARDWRVPLGLLISLNNSLGPSAPFVAATVLAIAASVALSTSLEMTSRGIELEAEQTTAALIGSAQIEIVGGELGVPESLVEAVNSLPGVLVGSPLINAVVRADSGRLPLHAIGVDLTLAADAREMEVRAGGVRVNDPLRLLSQPDAALITTSLAERLGVRLGGTFIVRSDVGEHTLSVQGLLENRGIASAFNGQILVMDVYALQAMLGRAGSVDRIDVVAQPGRDADALLLTITNRVAGMASVRRAGTQRSALDQTIAALRVAVLIVAVIGSLVSGLMSYSAMSTAVEGRLRELYVLRSTGVSARTIATW
ncbi:MAG: ABC transporter permease, partial [Thermomicrobiales bacterium]